MIHHQACLPMGLVEVGIHSTNQSTNQYLKSHSVILHLKKKLMKFVVMMSFVCLMWLLLVIWSLEKLQNCQENSKKLSLNYSNQLFVILLAFTVHVLETRHVSVLLVTMVIHVVLQFMNHVKRTYVRMMEHVQY